ncbi:MAG: D-alanine--D-alanine ligase [Patescibacteria group bacterium]|nr:D-alanine--D-alanine ligase [Patescibacteria group bacterium]
MNPFAKSPRKKVRVALICGGPSSEREVSLKSGDQIAKALDRKRYDVSLVEIAKDGRWFLSPRSRRGGAPSKALTVFPKDKALERNDLRNIDVAFLALHGYFGEDGKIQSILELLGIPYTGSGVMASAIAMNKAKTAELAALGGLKIPDFDLTIETGAGSRVGYPCIVKPNESGSSVGTSLVEKDKKLKPAIEKALSESKEAVIQKYIRGRELTCGVMGNTGRTGLIALPPIEIVSSSKFFDYQAKYSSRETREICPAPVAARVARALQESSKKIHALLGCDGLTRSDFILDKKGALWFLEINTIPGMTEASLAPKAARAFGWSFPEFLDKIIELALEKGSR